MRSPRRASGRRRNRSVQDWGSLRTWALALAFFLLFSILMIAQRVQVIRLGREIEQLRLKRRELVDEVRDLDLKFSEATKLNVIQSRAHKELGFVAPPVRDLYVDP